MSIFNKTNKEEHTFKLEFTGDFCLQNAWNIYDETDDCIFVIKRKTFKLHPTLEIYECKKKRVVATITNISNPMLLSNGPYEIIVEGEPFDIIRFKSKNTRFVSDRIGLDMEMKLLNQVFHLNGHVVAESKLKKGRCTIYFDNRKLKMYLLLVFFCYVLQENVNYKRIERENSRIL